MKDGKYVDLQKFINEKAEDVFLLKILYLVSMPLVNFFLKRRFSANQLTSISNLLSISALVSIFYSFYLFAFFWILALIFDIADGTLARAMNSSSAFGSFYDHFSDHIKILVFFIAIGLYYNKISIWFLISINMVLLSSIDYLDQIYFKYKIICKGLKINYENKEKRQNILIKKVIDKFKQTEVYKTLFIMHGQFNLVLIPIAYNKDTAIYFLILVLVIQFTSFFQMLNAVVSTARFIGLNKLEWK